MRMIVRPVIKSRQRRSRKSSKPITKMEVNMWHRTRRFLMIVFLVPACASMLHGQEQTSAEGAQQEGMEIHPDGLEEYVGEYLIFPGFTMKIDREGNQLYAQPSGQKRAQLTAIEPDRFSVKIVDGNLTFERDPQGRVVAMIIKQGNSEGYGKRISTLDPKVVAEARSLMETGKVTELKTKFEALAEKPEKEIDALLVICELLNPK